MPLATNKTDNTAALSDHAGHHNAMATAVNRLDARAYDPANYGAGTTDVELQAAIDAAYTAGGGAVLVPAGTWTLSSTVTFKDKVLVIASPGTTFAWSGSTSGSIFATGTSQPTLKAGFIGRRCAIAPGSGFTGKVFDLHSPQFCEFGEVDIGIASATATILSVRADVTNATGGYNSVRNAKYSTYRDFVCNETHGRTIQMYGAGAGGSSPSTGVVTLNTFSNFQSYNVNQVGVDMLQWCDNNTFVGQQRYALADGSSAIGVQYGDPAVTSGAEIGVYSNRHYALAVDIFGSGTGRTAVVHGWKSKDNKIFNGHVDPLPAGNTLFTASLTPLSYYMEFKGDSGTSTTIYNLKNYPDASHPIPLGPDANNWIGVSGSDPRWQADSGDYLAYDRTNNQWQFSVGNSLKLRATSSGIQIGGSAIWSTDASSSIGASGANRPLNCYLAGAVATKTKAGVPADGDFTNPVDGMIAVDTTNNKIYVRIGGTWKGVTVA